jgi:hypothetical protein
VSPRAPATSASEASSRSASARRGGDHREGAAGRVAVVGVGASAQQHRGRDGDQEEGRHRHVGPVGERGEAQEGVAAEARGVERGEALRGGHVAEREGAREDERQRERERDGPREDAAEREPPVAEPVGREAGARGRDHQQRGGAEEEEVVREREGRRRVQAVEGEHLEHRGLRVAEVVVAELRRGEEDVLVGQARGADHRGDRDVPVAVPHDEAPGEGEVQGDDPGGQRGQPDHRGGVRTGLRAGRAHQHQRQREGRQDAHAEHRAVEGHEPRERHHQQGVEGDRGGHVEAARPRVRRPPALQREHEDRVREEVEAKRQGGPCCGRRHGVDRVPYRPHARQ